MEYANIPYLDKQVCRVGLGTWAMGGAFWGGSEEKESINAIHYALDLGINLIDTAPVYGFGKSEEIIGKALKSYKNRNSVVVATKAGLQWADKEIFRDSRKGQIIQEVECSLKRLGIERIDLYQIHWPDQQTPLEETAEVMATLLKSGKIGAIGVSNFSKEEMEVFRSFAPIHTLQSPYNLFEREIDKGEKSYCHTNGIALLGYGAICRGLLSGKMDQSVRFKGDDIRQRDPKFQKPRFSHYLLCVDKLKLWSKERYNKPVLLLALRWVLDQGIEIPLWGIRRPKQLDILDGVWGWRLTESDKIELDRIVTETITHPIGPQFMAPPTKRPNMSKI